MNIKTEAVVSFKNDVPRIHVKKEEEEEEDRDDDDHNSSDNNSDSTATDTAGRRSCGFEQVKVKKEEEEEEEKEDDGNNNAEVNNCSNRKNANDDDDYYTDWTSGNWGWISPTSTTTTTNANANANANANNSAIPSATSSSSSCCTNTSISRKRTAASRSRNTTSVMKKDTSKSKKTRLLPPPPPPPSNNNRHATTVKREEEEEEDSVCYNDEVNNKANDDDDDDDDNDGYESWTEGNWCLILPSGSSSSSSTHTVANTKYTKKRNKRWNDMFHRLISYKNQHNSTSVPKKYAADPELGNWVNNQRWRCKNNPISEYRVNLLNSIGFVWNALDNQWNEMFQRLVTYKNQRNGSTSVPQQYGADIQLGRWVHWQRYSYSIKMISVHQIDRLESIGFVWNARCALFLDGKWMEAYDRLVAYKKQHKSTRVPRTYIDENNDIPLGRWVSTQRTAYNQGLLLEKRKDLLNSIDFAWNGKSRPR
jgi:hypothetical protein